MNPEKEWFGLVMFDKSIIVLCFNESNEGKLVIFFKFREFEKEVTRKNP